MIKARAGDHIFFGLSEVNLQRLREGRPIKVDLAEIGLTGTVLIFYGETEEKMRDDLAELIGPETDYRDTLRKN